MSICMTVLLTELCPFIPLQLPSLYFKVIALLNSFNWNCYVVIRLNWNIFLGFLSPSSRSWIYLFLLKFRMRSKEITDLCSNWKKKVGLFSDTIKARSFKLSLNVKLLGVCIFIVDSMTLTLFQGYSCVRNINFKYTFFSDCCSL